LGVLQSRGLGGPLRVYEVDDGRVVPKLEGQDQLFYRSLTVKCNDAGFPVYDDEGMPRFNEVSECGGDEDDDDEDGGEDGNGNAFNGIAGLYGFLSTVRTEAEVSGVKYDYSDVWETTTEASEAIRDNLVVVRAHRFAGYWAYQQSFEVVSRETVDVSVGERAATVTAVALNYQKSVREKMTGQVDWRIQVAVFDADDRDKIDEWKTLESVRDWLDHQGSVLRIDVEFDGDKPAVVDSNMVTNLCKYVAAAGLWIDGSGLPQWVDCGVLPFNMGVACLVTVCLYRISAAECSPAYQAQSYPILLGTRFLQLGAVNYQPSYKPCN